MTSLRLGRRSVVAGLALAPLAARAARLAGEISLVGYNDMAEMIAGLDAAFQAAHPDIRFRTDLRGTRFGPEALAEGRATIAPMGALFTPAQLQGYRTAVRSAPAGFPIAHASLSPKALSGPNAVFVHRDNPITAAALPALAALFTRPGPHLWRTLGATGPIANQPVRVAGLSPETPLALEMQAAAFPGQPFASELKGFGQSRDVIACVGSDPLALGFAALNRAEGPVRALALRRSVTAPAIAASAETLRSGSYPLDRHLWLYARRDAAGALDPLARAYIRFALSDRGQAIVAAGTLGYLPLGTQERRREQARVA